MTAAAAITDLAEPERLLVPPRAAPGLAHRLWRYLPQGGRRAAAVHLAAWLAPRPGLPPAVATRALAVAGELGRASGLGEGARLMLRAAARHGVPVYDLPLDGRPDLPPDGVPVVIHANAPLLPAALLRLPRRLPRGRRTIGYWAWELPVVPRCWRAGLPFVHEIWVPSRFTAAALTPLGAPYGLVPRVVPHPVALDPALSPHAPPARTRADLGFAPDAVVVLTCFSLASSFARKNPLGAIAAFIAAFGARPDRRLVLKLSHAEHFPADLSLLRDAVVGHDNIHLDTRLLSRADMLAMTAHADIVLSLHRAEGFGLVPAEAMLLARPVIATGWSGNMDFMDANCAALVAYRLIPARDPRGVFEAPGAVWAEPELDAAVTLLRDLAEDAGLRQRLGQAAASHAHAALGPAALDAALESLWRPAL